MKGISIKQYLGHGHEVFDVAIAEDNSRLASCGGDKNVFYWVGSVFSGHAPSARCHRNSRVHAQGVVWCKGER